MSKKKDYLSITNLENNKKNFLNRLTGSGKKDIVERSL
jgi:hypothetical protein